MCFWIVAALLTYLWQALSERSNKKYPKSKYMQATTNIILPLSLFCIATATCWHLDTIITNYSVLSPCCEWMRRAQHNCQGPFFQYFLSITHTRTHCLLDDAWAESLAVILNYMPQTQGPSQISSLSFHLAHPKFSSTRINIFSLLIEPRIRDRKGTF